MFLSNLKSVFSLSGKKPRKAVDCSRETRQKLVGVKFHRGSNVKPRLHRIATCCLSQLHSDCVEPKGTVSSLSVLAVKRHPNTWHVFARRRVSYLLAWREVFSTQAFCTKPCHGCCSPPEHSMSDGATNAYRISISSYKFYTTQQSKLQKPWHCILFDLSSLSQRTMKQKFKLQFSYQICNPQKF